MAMELEMADEIMDWVFRGLANEILDEINTGIFFYAASCRVFE